MSGFIDHGAPRSLVATARYLSRDECEAIAKKVLGFSTADEARVTISSGMRGNTRYAVNQVSTAGDNYDAGSILDQSWCCAPAHPEPVPSAVRTVVVIVEPVSRR